MRICSVGHDALSKMLVEGRNGREICRGTGRVYNLSVIRAEEKGGDAAFVLTMFE